MNDDKTEGFWQRFQEIMGYDDAQLAKFRSIPKFTQMMAKPAFRTHKIVAEVISSNGCVNQHTVGQRIIMSGNGAFISAECPKIMCVFLVSQLTGVVYSIHERIAAGLDPNGLLLSTISCPDVGLECGGWGRVLVKVHVEGP